MKNTFNDVCKGLLILLLAVFLYLYYLSSNNTRYHFVETSKIDEETVFGVFDSKTANCYVLLKDKGWSVFSPFTKSKILPESK